MDRSDATMNYTGDADPFLRYAPKFGQALDQGIGSSRTQAEEAGGRIVCRIQTALLI